MDPGRRRPAGPGPADAERGPCNRLAEASRRTGRAAARAARPRPPGPRRPARGPTPDRPAVAGPGRHPGRGPPRGPPEGVAALRSSAMPRRGRCSPGSRSIAARTGTGRDNPVICWPWATPSRLRPSRRRIRHRGRPITACWCGSSSPARTRPVPVSSPAMCCSPTPGPGWRAATICRSKSRPPMPNWPGSPSSSGVRGRRST